MLKNFSNLSLTNLKLTYGHAYKFTVKSVFYQASQDREFNINQLFFTALHFHFFVTLRCPSRTTETTAYELTLSKTLPDCSPMFTVQPKVRALLTTCLS